jgi:hypothetical protein
MEFKILIYVIIGVIYLLTRVLKKSDKKPGETSKYNPTKPVEKFDLPTVKPSANTSTKQLTFEELLREITESKTSTSSPKPSYGREPEVVDYDDNLGEEEQDLEDVDYSYKKKDNIYELYERAKREAFVRPSLEETMSVTDTVVKFGKFKEFEQESRRDLIAEYLADFKDPEGFKKAVVMSEILKRKF